MRDFAAPVHDGDTVWLELDKGHRDQSTKDIRMRWVGAPELKDPGGEDVHQFVIAWLDRYSDSRWPLSVETFQTTGDNDVMTLNRYVGAIYYGDPEAVRARALLLPCLNNDVQWYIAEHGWGHGIG